MARVRIQGTAFQQVGRSFQLLTGALITARNQDGGALILYDSMTETTSTKTSVITGNDASYDFYVDDFGEFVDLEISSGSSNVDKRVPIFAGKAELTELDAVVLATKAAVDIESARNREDIDNIRAAIGQGGVPGIFSGYSNVDPTTLTENVGSTLSYRGTGYFWNGGEYTVIQDASQISQEFNGSVLYADNVIYIRELNGQSWVRMADTSNAAAITAPLAPTASFVSRDDGAVTYAVTFDADNGGAAYTDAILIYTPAGSPVPLEVSTGLTATGNYQLTGLQDGQNPNPVFVTVNASNLRSLPSAPVPGAAQDIPEKYVLDEADVTPGEETLTITLEDQETNGLTRTDFEWELVEVV